MVGRQRGTEQQAGQGTRQLAVEVGIDQAVPRVGQRQQQGFLNVGGQAGMSHLGQKIAVGRKARHLCAPVSPSQLGACGLQARQGRGKGGQGKDDQRTVLRRLAHRPDSLGRRRLGQVAGQIGRKHGLDLKGQTLLSVRPARLRVGRRLLRTEPHQPTAEARVAGQRAAQRARLFGRVGGDQITGFCAGALGGENRPLEQGQPADHGQRMTAGG